MELKDILKHIEEKEGKYFINRKSNEIWKLTQVDRVNGTMIFKRLEEEPFENSITMDLNISTPILQDLEEI